jgi:hypothetical protein
MASASSAKLSRSRKIWRDISQARMNETPHPARAPTAAASASKTRARRSATGGSGGWDMARMLVQVALMGKLK